MHSKTLQPRNHDSKLAIEHSARNLARMERDPIENVAHETNAPSTIHIQRSNTLIRLAKYQPVIRANWSRAEPGSIFIRVFRSTGILPWQSDGAANRASPKCLLWTCVQVSRCLDRHGYYTAIAISKVSFRRPVSPYVHRLTLAHPTSVLVVNMWNLESPFGCNAHLTGYVPDNTTLINQPPNSCSAN